MEFLVRIDVALSPDMDPHRRAELEDQERRTGERLLSSGVIERIWRLPGRTANLGIWRAADATELHRHLRSLPLAPWMDIDVTALAEHPLSR